jgi:hypothetical protein
MHFMERIEFASNASVSIISFQSIHIWSRETNDINSDGLFVQLTENPRNIAVSWPQDISPSPEGYYIRSMALSKTPTYLMLKAMYCIHSCQWPKQYHISVGLKADSSLLIAKTMAPNEKPDNLKIHSHDRDLEILRLLQLYLLLLMGTKPSVRIRLPYQTTTKSSISLWCLTWDKGVFNSDWVTGYSFCTLTHTRLHKSLQQAWQGR